MTLAYLIWYSDNLRNLRSQFDGNDRCIFISSHKKATVALSFGRIRTRLGPDPFQIYHFLTFHVNLLLVRSHQAEIIMF